MFSFVHDLWMIPAQCLRVKRELDLKGSFYFSLNQMRLILSPNVIEFDQNDM